MKKVIDGLVYNTETAEVIAESDSAISPSDFRWCEEALYRTKRGRYFLAGEGGPLSDWREGAGNGWISGSGMRVLSEAGALAWCEANGVKVETIANNFDIDEA